MFGITALVSAISLCLYRRMAPADRKHAAVWRAFGKFSGLCMMGCLSGATAWYFQTKNIDCSFQVSVCMLYPGHCVTMVLYRLGQRLEQCVTVFFQSEKLRTRVNQSSEILIVANKLSACAYCNNVVFVLGYGVEFFCLTLAKLLSLQRVLDFIFHFRPLNITRLRAIILWTVMAGNTLGLAAMVSAAVYSYEASYFYTRLSQLNASDAASDSVQELKDTMTMLGYSIKNANTSQKIQS